MIRERTEDIENVHSKEIRKLEAMNRLEITNYEQYMGDVQEKVGKLEGENAEIKKLF